jgi:hypothetical protein
VALKKNEKRLLMILGVAVLGFFIDRFVISSKGKDVSPQETESDKEAIRVVDNTQLINSVNRGSASAAAVKLQVKRFDTWGRDPFEISKLTSKVGYSSTSKRKGKVSKPVLKGIFWKKGKPYVLIDDNVLSEGEEKGGIRVKRIQGTEVLCYRGSQSFTLHWRESP